MTSASQVILEYLESSITTKKVVVFGSETKRKRLPRRVPKKPFSDFPACGPGMYTLS